MKRKTFFSAFVLACATLLMWGGGLIAAQEPAKVAGTWEMSVEGRSANFTQTLTIQQDGRTIKGTSTGRGGELPLEGSVTGNKISFTVKRETPSGTFTQEYSGTVEGDSMRGKVHGGRFDRGWTAKRTSDTGKK